MKNLDMNSLEYHVVKAQKTGISDENIKKEAVSAGWDIEEVERILFKKSKKTIFFMLLFLSIILSLFLFLIIINDPKPRPFLDIFDFLVFFGFLIFEFIFLITYSLFLFFIAENRRDAILYFFVSLGVSFIIWIGVVMIIIR